MAVCPELRGNSLDKHAVQPKKNKITSYWYKMYETWPIADEYDLKLLINTIGLRMMHFVDNKQVKKK